MQQAPIDRVLAALSDVKQRKPDEWLARCPAHDDDKQSLSIGLGDRGVVLKCFAGCDTAAVVAAVGLTLSDLFPPRQERPASARRRIVATYPYTDERGELLYQVLRYEPKDFRQRRPDPNREGAWLWSLQGVRRVLYRFPEVAAAVAENRGVFLVEGEKDADALARLGIVATTNAGGADKWSADYTEALSGAHVVILPDNDDAGRKHARRAGADLDGRAKTLRVLELPGLPPKGDVSDWLKVGGTAEELRTLARTAPAWSEWNAQQPAVTTPPEPERDGLPVIETNNRPPREQAEAALSALIAANDPPSVFVRAGVLVRVGRDENDRPKVEQLTADTLSYYLARAANFVSTSEKRGQVPVWPPARLLADLLAAPSWSGVPPLAGVVTSPVVAPDGTLVTAPGYLPAARLYYHEAASFDLADTTPTAVNVETARELLADTLLGDFPFVDQASRANALALLLLPFVRPYIAGNTPLHLIDAPVKGTGKTLLGDAISAVFMPGGAPKTTAPTGRGGNDEEEWRKKITSGLQAGGPFFFVDNIAGTLASPSLDMVLTAREWSDRPLGKTAMVTLPVRCVFLATANNVEVGGDTDRRTVWIRLDSGEERPEDRSDFKIADLAAYVAQERPRLLAAVLTILRAWIEAGRPKWSGKAVGSFEAWSLTMGGILEAVGVDGFLGNREEMYARLDPERQKWADFFDEWHQAYSSKPVGVADLAAIAWRLDLIEDQERGGRTKLGALLRARLDRVSGGRRLVSGGEKQRAAQYKLVSSETVALSLGSEPSEPSEPAIPLRERVSGNWVDTSLEGGWPGSQGSLGSHGDPLLAGLTDPFAEEGGGG